MSPKNPTIPRLQPALGRRLWALLCLLGFLVSGTGAGPLVAALIARQDTQHVVRLSSDDGKIRIVMHHDETRPDRILDHQHQMPGRLLAFLAEPVGEKSKDHIVTFPNSAKPIPGGDDLKIRPGDTLATPIFWLLAEVEWPSVASKTICYTRPPPQEFTSSHMVVRATVFLI